MGMPITPNINHTAKHTMKAHVVTARTMRLLDLDILPPTLSRSAAHRRAGSGLETQ
jgi:hypothetical protein